VVSSLADEPAPYAGYCALLDGVWDRTIHQPSTRTVAVGVLERVVEGRAGEVSAESEVQVGLSKGMLQRKEFGVPTVRACALRKLGETALPEALQFLASLKQADFSEDRTQQIWPAAQIALKDALLRGIVDPQSRVNFLEKILTDSRGNPARWPRPRGAIFFTIRAAGSSIWQTMPAQVGQRRPSWGKAEFYRTASAW
jgi:hypothetical protein